MLQSYPRVMLQSLPANPSAAAVTERLLQSALSSRTSRNILAMMCYFKANRTATEHASQPHCTVLQLPRHARELRRTLMCASRVCKNVSSPSPVVPLTTMGPTGHVSLGPMDPMGPLWAMSPMGPMGPMGPIGSLGPMGPMGPMGPLGFPWTPWVPRVPWVRWIRWEPRVLIYILYN